MFLESSKRGPNFSDIIFPNSVMAHFIRRKEKKVENGNVQRERERERERERKKRKREKEEKDKIGKESM